MLQDTTEFENLVATRQQQIESLRRELANLQQEADGLRLSVSKYSFREATH